MVHCARNDLLLLGRVVHRVAERQPVDGRRQLRIDDEAHRQLARLPACELLRREAEAFGLAEILRRLQRRDARHGLRRHRLRAQVARVELRFVQLARDALRAARARDETPTAERRRGRDELDRDRARLVRRFDDARRLRAACCDRRSRSRRRARCTAAPARSRTQSCRPRTATAATSACDSLLRCSMSRCRAYAHRDEAEDRTRAASSAATSAVRRTPRLRSCSDTSAATAYFTSGAVSKL